MENRCTLLFLLCFNLVILPVAQADIVLPPFFSSNMILQRDQPVTIWGSADKRERVEVLIGKALYEVRADRNGKWAITLPPMPAGGPHEINLFGKNDVYLHNVWFGDIWVVAGEPAALCKANQDSSISTSGDLVRWFNVPVQMDYLAREELSGGEWQTLDTGSEIGLNAIAQRVGCELQREQEVPVGLIQVGLESSAIETWMSYAALGNFEQFVPEILPVMSRGKSFAELRSDFEKKRAGWEKYYYHIGPGIKEEWYGPEVDLSRWKDVEVPGYWELQELTSFDGAVWYRTTFDLPLGFAGDSILISCDQIDDFDICWINGRKVGETFGAHTLRRYRIPVSGLKAKGNLLVIRAFDTGGYGGFGAPVLLEGKALSSKWKYRTGQEIDPNAFPNMNLPNASPFSSPGVLFNGSIAPLTQIPIRGIMWFPGLANVSRAHEFGKLFPALIRDWRKQWGIADLPFLYVQLPATGSESAFPGESTCAELRDAQSSALELPGTGMAISVDVHPEKYVEVVGNRLRDLALEIAYKSPGNGRSPEFRTHEIRGNRVIIQFDHVGDGLSTPDKYGYVRGFQIAGADRKFLWAKAAIMGSRIMIYNDSIAEPVAVRYGWADNPGQIDLKNAAGLPVVPFRTDDWPGLTEDRRFERTASRY